MFIPVNEPIISKEAKENVLEALDTGWISSAGKFVKEFEEDFARYLGIKHAVVVNSGTAAIHIGLLALGVKKGDEVILPAFTMAGSWLPILYIGAKPVFVDCELDTFNIDTYKIEKKITEKTKVIMPVHLFGHSCDMGKIIEISKKYNLNILEDAAEVHGGEYEGKKCGAMSDVGCFSFFANKIITTGEGGMAVTNNDETEYKLRKLRDMYHSDQKRFIHNEVGFNYRITNLQAGVGLGELKNIDSYIEKKKWMAKLYNESLKGIPGIRIPITKPNVKNVYWMYTILIDKDRFGMDKDDFRIKLKDNGVDTRDFFYPPTDQGALKEYLEPEEDFPNTKYIAQNGCYLPSGLAITEEQIKYTCEQIKKICPKNFH